MATIPLRTDTLYTQRHPVQTQLILGRRKPERRPTRNSDPLKSLGLNHHRNSRTPVRADIDVDTKKAGRLDPPILMTLLVGATGIEPMTSTVSR